MRAITTDQSNMLAKGAYDVVAKVEIDRTGSGSWVDLTAFEPVTNGGSSAFQARNFVREITIEDSVDNPTATATVILERSMFYYNLSPLMTGSVANTGGALVNIYQKIRISVAVVPPAWTPSASDYVYIFKGRIFSVDWAADDLKIECRDFGGDLMDVFIENNAIPYGSTAGVLAESVMQSILTNQSAHLPAAVTLYSVTGTGGTPFQGADSPGWAIHTYNQDMMPTMGALNVLASQIGWLLRYKWNSNVGDYVLTWYDPLRGNTTSNRTFSASQYFKITECSLHLGDIRNVVRVYYTDTSGNKQSYLSSDSTSITNYGRKYMQIAEEATSQINTSTEAQKMADGCVSDLAEPVMTHSVEMPFFWPVELTDVYTFAANGVHYDTDQKLAVFGFTHNISNKRGITTMSLRGKPAGGVKTWYTREVEQVRKQFGHGNLSASFDQDNQYPNSNFGSFSRG